MHCRSLAVVLATGALLAGCDGAPRRSFDRVVIVTFDTTRADHLGAYGYPRATTPFFDALAARGVLFERAIAPNPSTAPSHATMFTGLYPLEHGIGRNGIRLPEAIPTAAELFRDAGYATAGFVSFRLLVRSGLERGFDFVAFADEPPEGGGPSWRRADETTADAIAWLRGQPRDRPFFLWVHYYDPHTPYDPPAAALAAVRRESGPISTIQQRLLGAHGIRLGAYGGDLGRMLERVDLYDGELRAMDDGLRRLYQAFVGLGLAGGSVWVMVGDHGEGLGSHDWLQHGVRIYQEQMRVPLLVHASDGVWPARRVEEIVELVDLLPTLAAFAGREPPHAKRGHSLLPALAGEPAQPGDREALVQRRTFGSPRPEPSARFVGEVEAWNPGGRLEVAERWEAGERLALIGRRWKYLHWTAGPAELYDLENDPRENRNLVAERPEIVAEMRERLLARARTLRSRQQAGETVDEHTLEVLRSLGYIQ